ncbi:unnamed protein product [Colias eurytheme]|nr:unnamed protein product [Colias eurytheme]
MDVIQINPQNVFDTELYESVLDPKECHKQLNYLSNSSLVLQFLDASAKIPSGVLSLNVFDYGDYYECLDIDHAISDMHIQGKYCMINIPFTQKSSKTNMYYKSMLPKFSTNDLMELFPEQVVVYFKSLFDNVENSPAIRDSAGSTLLSPTVKLALCIPRVCTVKQVENFINSPLPLPKVTYVESFCRLPNDIPYVTADYIAFGVFGILLLLTLLSTSYDLYQVFIRKKKEVSRILTSFSIYTNTRRLVNFESHKNALECVDGIRTLSMFWVICGHTYIFTFMTPPHNMSDVVQWSSYFSSTWIVACPIVVDTFFTLSGILCIYVIPNNITAKPFLKHIHIFYLYRILRMFPILATIVLLQTSIMTWISDGPDWEKMGMASELCRQRWWATLLHIQNFYRPLGICVLQSWYITVDTQLYLLSPFVIVFLLGSSLVAWIALTTVGLASMIIVVVYVVKYEFPSALMNVYYTDSFVNFFHDFYFNTATRASPFVIGILFGYLLKLYRGRKIELPMKYVIVFWITAFSSMAYCVFGIYETVSIPYEFTLFEAILNSIMRALWATSLCWLILACVHGYGGPINWFLSLPLWKLPARLSYAVYLVHLEILLVIKSSMVKLPYFTELEVMYEIAGITLLSLLLSFIMCVLIDAPASTLVKLLFMQKRPVENPHKSAAIEEDFSSENKCRQHFDK